MQYVERIHQPTVRNILREANLRLHQFRYWKTTIWDDEAMAHALKILWYYERINNLWQHGEVIFCQYRREPARAARFDEMALIIARFDKTACCNTQW